MIVEVIAVGTELLLGQVVNSNAAVIGSLLADRGFDAHYQQVVGDNLGRVTGAISLAMSRSDAVIITGGIGPTQDDLTREAVCAATGLAMEFDAGYADHLREWWHKRGRVMPESNLKQAQHPAGAELIMNPKGTAPGLALSHEGVLVFCVPGVPEEMRNLVETDVLPRLRTASGDEAVLASRLLRTWGRSESDVAEVLDDVYRGSTNPSIAFLASGGEIKIRISAKGANRSAAEELIEPVDAEVRRRLGEAVFATDGDTIETVVLRLLSERGLTIATAESMTGGLVAAALTSVPGASKVVRGGLVAYDAELKRALLGVGGDDPLVSEATAEQMARGGRELLGADVVVAVTGSAGPEPLERPPGTLVVAVSTPEATRSREMRLVGDRERVRAYGTTGALQLTRLGLLGRWWDP